MSAVLVFDVGTSALKATLFDRAGAIKAVAEAGYPPDVQPHRPDPEAWWQAAIATTRQLPPAAGSAAIALTGTMENLIPVSRDGAPVGPAIAYPDPCGAPWLEARRSALEAAGAAAITGNAHEPLMSVFKLAALRAAEPERFAAAACFLPGAKDYLALRLTGIAATDPACAATTGLMDIAARDWSDALLELHDLERARLPRILGATAVIGPLRAEAAAALGLPAGLPVVNGCGDGAATSLGGGADGTGDAGVYLGTSGWVARVAPLGDPAIARPFYRLPHPLHDGVVEIAPILSGGAATRWARTALGLELDRAEALAVAADAAPGAALFLPYLGGERSPFVDLELRAGFTGLDAADGPGALYYAVLEGVAFAIAANLEAMGGAGQGTVGLSGGGAVSRVWPQVIADVLGRPVAVPDDPVAATGRGAFRIAAAALGWSVGTGGVLRQFQPRPDRAARIDRQRRRFAAATALLRQLP